MHTQERRKRSVRIYDGEQTAGWFRWSFMARGYQAWEMAVVAIMFRPTLAAAAARQASSFAKVLMICNDDVTLAGSVAGGGDVVNRVRINMSVTTYNFFTSVCACPSHPFW